MFKNITITLDSVHLHHIHIADLLVAPIQTSSNAHVPVLSIVGHFGNYQMDLGSFEEFPKTTRDPVHEMKHNLILKIIKHLKRHFNELNKKQN